MNLIFVFSEETPNVLVGGGGGRYQRHCCLRDLAFPVQLALLLPSWVSSTGRSPVILIQTTPKTRKKKAAGNVLPVCDFELLILLESR